MKKVAFSNTHLLSQTDFHFLFYHSVFWSASMSQISCTKRTQQVAISSTVRPCKMHFHINCDSWVIPTSMEKESCNGSCMLVFLCPRSSSVLKKHWPLQYLKHTSGESPGSASCVLLEPALLVPVSFSMSLFSHTDISYH